MKDKKVIAIIGNVKNAGKTTVLNTLLKGFASTVNALTSIGLDGEAIDQVTFLPKPRIFVTSGSIVATAFACLPTCEARYEVLQTTPIQTALGPIVILKILQAGHCLVAGPSTLAGMERLLTLLKALNPERILVDGAFSRQSPAILADATILSVGADLSRDMNKVVEDASLKVRQLSLPYAGDELMFLDHEETIVFVMKDGSIRRINERSTLIDPLGILECLNDETLCLYCPKTLGREFLRLYVKRRSEVPLVILTPIHLQTDEQLIQRMDQWEAKISVLHPLHLAAVCLNPTSPKGYEFPKKQFFEAMKAAISLPLYNVLDEEGDPDE